VPPKQIHHQISLTLNTRRGTLPKQSRQSSRYTSGVISLSVERQYFTCIRSTLDESCDGTISMLTGSARCVASFKSADGTAHSHRKDAANENAPIIDPVWTKEHWTEVQGRPNTRDDAALEDASFQEPLWTRVRWTRVRDHTLRPQEKLLQVGHVASKASIDKSPLNSSPRSSEKKQTQKMFILCCILHCRASYGPKVE